MNKKFEPKNPLGYIRGDYILKIRWILQIHKHFYNALVCDVLKLMFFSVK